jgi:flagellar biosynthesis/type III secretory pathway protein FliH
MDLKEMVEKLKSRLAGGFEDIVETFVDDVVETAMAEGYQKALREYGKGRDVGYRLGFEQGKKEGYDEAYGKAIGLTSEDAVLKLRAKSYRQGRDDGYRLGNHEGYVEGYRKGRENGKKEGYEEGEEMGGREGFEHGCRVGRDAGYRRGYTEGREKTEEVGLRGGSSFGAVAARAAGLTGEEMVQELRRTERNVEIVEDEREQFPHDPVWTVMVDAFRRGDRDRVAYLRELIENRRRLYTKALDRFEYQIARANAMLAELGDGETLSD